MQQETLQDQVKEKLDALGEVEIVVGVPSYNNVRTIRQVMEAAHTGVLDAFPGRKALIVNSDSGSKDGTLEVIRELGVNSNTFLTVEHPLYPVHHLTMPYHRVPGKASAYRTLFRITELTQARALAVADADLSSITPQWFGELLRPVLDQQYDYVAPFYRRDKYEGTLTSGLVYPLTRALYGRRVRQPIGGEFGISRRLGSRFLNGDVWNTELASYGFDVWMTTTAIAENFHVCQAHLGGRIHDSTEPTPDLSSVLAQVVGSVFGLMETYDKVWRNVLGSLPAPLLGNPFEPRPDPPPLDVGRHLASYRQAMRDLLPVYERIISLSQLRELNSAAERADAEFALSDEVWVAVIYDFALAYHRRVMDREHLVKSLTPLYLGWVASFARQIENESLLRAESRIDKLCQVFEQLKLYLINQWPLQTGESRTAS